MTAAAVLSLVEDGAVDLDRPMVEQLDGFGATPQRWAAQITPRQLLNHTAGYPSYPDVFFELDDAEFEANDELHLLLSRYTDRFPLDFAPGTAWAYANFGYAALGWLSAEKHGAPFPTMIVDRVFTPFGMAGATFVFAEASRGDYASGHALENGALTVLDYELTNVQAHFASALLSARELGALMVALMDRMDRAPWSEMFTDTLPPGVDAYGRGMGLGLFVDSVEGAASHGGAVRGFLAYLVIVPAARLGFAFAINADDEDAFGEILEISLARFVP